MLIMEWVYPILGDDEDEPGVPQEPLGPLQDRGQDQAPQRAPRNFRREDRNFLADRLLDHQWRLNFRMDRPDFMVLFQV